MKIAFIVLLLLSFSSLLQAQAPQAFSYQAIARSTDGKPISNQNMSLRATIRRGNTQGTSVYQEHHDNLMTNTFGLFNVEIGKGIPKTGTFAQIFWGQGPYFLQIEIDPNSSNGSSYDLTSTAPILSVPYALYAEASNEKDGDPANEIQILTLNGNMLTLSKGGGSVILPTVGGGNYTAGLGINITGGTISNTGDTDPSNDITNTTPAGGDLTGVYPNPQVAPNAIGSAEITNGSITLNDLAIGIVPQSLNDLSDVNTAGVTIGQVLKWNGTAWVAASDNTVGTGSTTVNTTAPLIGDGGTGTPVTLGQNGAVTGQVLKWNGTAWLPANDIVGSGGDNWGTQTAQTNLTLTGNGTLASPLGLAQQGALTGQVLKWNGTAWLPSNDVGGGNGDNWGTQVVKTTPTLTGDGTAAAPLNLAPQGAVNGQTLKWNGIAWLPADDNTGATYTAGNGINISGNVIAAIDGSSTNELQQLTLSGAQLTLSNGGGTVTLPTGVTYTAGAGITLAGNIIAAADVSPTNELQDLSLAGNTLRLSNSGATVSLAPYLQTLSYDSTTQNISISGAGPIKLGNLGASFWKSAGLELEPKTSSLGVNIPSGNLRGGGAKGWEIKEVEGAGYMQLFKSDNNNKINVTLGGSTGIPNNGAISLYNRPEKQVVYLHADFANAGRLVTRGPDGTTTTSLIGHGFGNENNGEVHLFSNNNPVASLIGENGIGTLSLYKSDGKVLVNANQSGLDPEGGAVRVYSNNQAVARLYAESGSGALLISKQSGENLVTASKSFGDVGSVAVWEGGGNLIGDMSGCVHNAGVLSLYAATGKSILDMGHTDGQHLENGYMGVYNKISPSSPVAGFTTTDSLGIVFTNDIQANQVIFDNKTTGLWHTTIWDDADGGFQMIRNNVGSPRVFLYVDDDKGVVSADRIVTSVKNFRMDHPTDPTKEIYYACVEGPEAGAYERGTGHLINGEAFIPYTEHFGLVINPTTVTVQLTPQNADTYGLAVVEKTDKGFRVKELKGGKGNFAFDWEVKGVRKGYEDYQAVRNKDYRLQAESTRAKSTQTQIEMGCAGHTQPAIRMEERQSRPTAHPVNH